MNIKRKIFGIGLSKTGTTSLGAALNILEFRVIHSPYEMLNFRAPDLVTRICDGLNWRIPDLNREIPYLRHLLYGLGKNQTKFDFLSEYEAAMDLPVGLYYRQLDEYYPGSKFILTVRNDEDWLESARQHFAPRSVRQDFHTFNRTRLDVYGSILFNEKKFLDAYRKHVRGVRHYFKDRPNDLTVLDIPSGDGWDILCPFVGKPIPNEPFPHANKSRDRV